MSKDSRNLKQQKKSRELVAGPRELKYGHPKQNYRRIAKIWSAVLGIEVTPTQAVLCELGVKFSRLIQSPDDEDTQVDIHGYIGVLQRLLDPEDQPAPVHRGIRWRVRGTPEALDPEDQPSGAWYFRGRQRSLWRGDEG